MSMKKVTLGFAESDIDNVEYIKEMLHSRSKAAAVGQSLDLARLIVEAKKKGNKIFMTDKDGNKQELLIPGIR